MEEYYKAYFERLAQNHKLIAHTDTQSAFSFVDDPYDLEAFDNVVKSLGKTPALVLEQYNFNLSDASRNYFKHPVGRFNVLVKTTRGDRATKEAAYKAAEAIAEDIIARMRLDLGEGSGIPSKDLSITSPKVFFSVGTAKLQNVGPIAADYYGFTCMFEWKTSFVNIPSSSQWTDL